MSDVPISDVPMSDVQVQIQKIDVLLQKDPESKALSSDLFNLALSLAKPPFAKAFLQQDGLNFILKLLKSDHETVKEITLRCFLNLMCHYSICVAVLEDNYLKNDLGILCSLLSCIRREEQFGEGDLIKSSMSALTFFIQMLPNGFPSFREAISSVSKENWDPYEAFSQHIIDAQLYREALHLVQVIIRNSVLTNTTEPIDRLKKNGIVNNLLSLKNLKVEKVVLSEGDKLLIEEILLPFGDSCSKVGWFIETIKRQPTKKVIQNTINGMNCLSRSDILRIAEERLEDKLEEHLIEIHDSIEKEFSRLTSNYSIGSPTSTSSFHSPQNSRSPDVGFRSNECIPVTTTTTTSQVVTRKAPVQSGHLCEDQKCTFTPCVFLRTIFEYLNTFFRALKCGGGAPIELEEINQRVDLPGKGRRRSTVRRMTIFRKGNKRESKEEQIFLLTDAVSDFTARTLVLRYYSALLLLSESDGQKLAEGALWKIMDGLRVEQANQNYQAILKSITNNPQNFIKKALSYVSERSLPLPFQTSIHVLHPQDGNISLDDFFAKNNFHNTRVRNPSSVFEPFNSNLPSPISQKAALARLEDLDTQLHQTIMTLKRLEDEVRELRSFVNK